MNIPKLTVSETKMVLTTITDGLVSNGKATTTTRQGIFVWGEPGIGKSDLVRQIAESEKRQLFDIRLSLIDPSGLTGLMAYDHENKKTVNYPSVLLPDHDGKGKYLLFLDELSSAPPLVQSQAYQLILDKKLGEYYLPKDTLVIAAGNKLGDGAVSFQMSTALANRFSHFELKPDAKEWNIWALVNGVDSLIIAFLQQNPDMLHKFISGESGLAYPSPRSWTFVSNNKALRELKNKDAFRLYFDAVAGTVGKDAAAKFESWLQVRDMLPDVEDILSKKAYDLPTDIGGIYLLMAYLHDALFDKVTEVRLNNYFDFLDNFEGTKHAEMGAVYVDQFMLKASSFPTQFKVVAKKEEESKAKKTANKKKSRKDRAKSGPRNFKDEVARMKCFIDWSDRNS